MKYQPKYINLKADKALSKKIKQGVSMLALFAVLFASLYSIGIFNSGAVTTKTIYLNPLTGKDENNGATMEKAVATLEKALALKDEAQNTVIVIGGEGALVSGDKTIDGGSGANQLSIRRAKADENIKDSEGNSEDYTGAMIIVGSSSKVIFKNIIIDNTVGFGKTGAVILKDGTSDLTIGEKVGAIGKPIISLSAKEKLRITAPISLAGGSDETVPKGVFALENSGEYAFNEGDIWVVNETPDSSDIWSSFVLSETMGADSVLQGIDTSRNSLAIFKALDKVYVNFVDGNDMAGGKTAETAVKTLKAAFTRAVKAPYTVIVTGASPMMIDKDTTINGMAMGAKGAVTIERAGDFVGSVFQVDKGALTLENLVIKGDNQENRTIIDVKAGAKLVIGKNVSSVDNGQIAIYDEYAVEIKESLKSGVFDLLPGEQMQGNGKKAVLNSIAGQPIIYEMFAITDIDLETRYVIQPLLDGSNSIEINEKGYRIYFNPIRGIEREAGGNTPKRALKRLEEAIDSAYNKEATIVVMDGPCKISSMSIEPYLAAGRLTIVRDVGYTGEVFTILPGQNATFKNVTMDGKNSGESPFISTGNLSKITMLDGVEAKNSPIISLTSTATVHVGKAPIVTSSKFVIDTMFTKQGGLVVMNGTGVDLLEAFALASSLDGYTLGNIDQATKNIGLYRDEVIVYINPDGGSNENEGKDPAHAVKTLQTAIDKIVSSGKKRGQIILLGAPIGIADTVTVNPGDDTDIIISRYEGLNGTGGYSGDVLALSTGATLEISNLTFDAGTVAEGKTLIMLGADSQLIMSNVRNIGSNKGTIGMDEKAKPIIVKSLPEGNPEDVSFVLNAISIPEGSSQTRMLVKNDTGKENIMAYFTPSPLIPAADNEIYSLNTDLWIRRKIYYKGVMYISGTGDDKNDGSKPESAVKTYKRGLEIINSMRDEDLLPQEVVDIYGNKRHMAVCATVPLDNQSPFARGENDKDFTIVRNSSLSDTQPLFTAGKDIKKTSGLVGIDIDNKGSNGPVIVMSTGAEASPEITLSGSRVDGGNGVAIAVLAPGTPSSTTRPEFLYTANIYLDNTDIKSTGEYAITFASNTRDAITLLTNCTLQIGEKVNIDGTILLDGPGHDLVFSELPEESAKYTVHSNTTWPGGAVPEYNRGNIIAKAPGGKVLDPKNFAIITEGYSLGGHNGNIYVYETGAVFLDNTHGKGDDSNLGTLEAPFKTAEKAISAAKANSGTKGAGIVYLLSPVSVGETVSLNGNGGVSPVTFLRFNYLMVDKEAATAADMGSMFIVEKNGKLSIENMTLDAYFYGSHTIQSPYITPAYVKSGGELTLLDKATIKNSYYRGVYVDGGLFTMENGSSVTNNVTLYHHMMTEHAGGGVYVNGGKLVINGGSVNNNGLHVLDGKIGQKVHITVTSEQQYRTHRGGGVAMKSGEIVMNGGAIEKNVADSMGGGVFMERGNLTVNKNASITGNTCVYSDSKGGGIYAQPGASSTNKNIITIDGGNVSNNSLAHTQGKVNGGTYKFLGGGMYVERYNIVNVINGGKINGNTAQLKVKENTALLSYTGVGGIYVGNGANLVVDNGYIENNKVVYECETNKGSEVINYFGEQVYNEGVFDFKNGNIKGFDKEKYLIYTTGDNDNTGYINLYGGAEAYNADDTQPLIYAVNPKTAPIVLNSFDGSKPGQKYTVHTTSVMGDKMIVNGAKNNVQAKGDNFEISTSAKEFGLGFVVKGKDIWVSTTLIYIDGVAGDNKNDGSSVQKAVRTFKRAKEILDVDKASQIIIVNTITVTGVETWDLHDPADKDWQPKLVARDGLDKDLVVVGKGGDLTLKNVTIDGNKKAQSNKDMSAVVTDYDGKLSFEDGAVLTNNVGRGITMKRDSKVDMIGGSINSSVYGVYFDMLPSGGGSINCIFNMSGGEIKGCSGEALRASVDNFTVNGGVEINIVGDSTSVPPKEPSITENAGVLLLNGRGSVLNITNSKGITGNDANSIMERRLIWVRAAQSVTIQNSTIANNTEFYRAVDIGETPEVLIENSIFSDNTKYWGPREGTGAYQFNVSGIEIHYDNTNSTAIGSFIFRNNTVMNAPNSGVVIKKNALGTGDITATVQNNKILNCGELGGQSKCASLDIININTVSLSGNTISDNITRKVSNSHGLSIANANKVEMRENTIQGVKNTGTGETIALMLSEIQDFTMASGTIQNNGRGVSITTKSSNKESYKFEGGVISGNSITGNVNGGGMYIKGVAGKAANTEVSVNCAVQNNSTATGLGGGIYVENATMSVKELADISANKGKQGGGIYISNAAVTLEGGSVSDNFASNGGGIYLRDALAVFNMSSGNVNNNTATENYGEATWDNTVYNGGGINAQYGAVTINGGEISGNKALFATKRSSNNNGNGGGIYINQATVTMSGGVMSNNLAKSNAEALNSGNGGGAYVAAGANGKFYLQGGTISDNTAEAPGLSSAPGITRGKGGNIYIVNKATFTMSGGSVGGGKTGLDGKLYTAKGSDNPQDVADAMNLGRTIAGEKVGSGGIHLQDGNLNVTQNDCIVKDIIYLNNGTKATSAEVTIVGSMSNRKNSIYLYSVNYDTGKVLVKPSGELVDDASSALSLFKLVTQKESSKARSIEKYQKYLVLGQAVFIDGTMPDGGTGENPSKAYNSLSDEGIKDALKEGATVYVSGPVTVDSEITLSSLSPYSSFVRYSGFDVSDIVYVAYVGDLITIKPGGSLTLDATAKDCEMGIMGSGTAGVTGRLVNIEVKPKEDTRAEGVLKLMGNITIKDNSASAIGTGAGIYQGGILEVSGKVKILDEVYLATEKIITVIGGKLSDDSKIAKINVQDPYIKRVVVNYPSGTAAIDEMGKHALVTNNVALNRYSLGSDKNNLILAGLMVKIEGDIDGNRTEVYKLFDVLGVTLQNAAETSTLFQTGHFVKDEGYEREYYYIKSGKYNVNITLPVGYDYDLVVETESGRTAVNGKTVTFGSGSDPEYNMVTLVVKIKEVKPVIDWGKRKITYTK